MGVGEEKEEKRESRRKEQKVKFESFSEGEAPVTHAASDQQGATVWSSLAMGAKRFVL